MIAALGSCLEARTRDGLWSVRIDDVDGTREVPGATDLILRTLSAFGFEWDGPIVRQSERTPAYLAALETLRNHGQVFECSCTRREIDASGTPLAGDERRYPGTCRLQPLHADRPLATRLRVPAGPVAFSDALQGLVTTDVAAESGDFVVRRRDGYIAYQLAVVVDDHDLGVTDVVRGADLLGSTARQILLQRALGLPSPRYAHLPLAVDALGAKLSKSAQSLAIEPAAAGPLLWQALQFLGQGPPTELGNAPPGEVWGWALRHWSLEPLRNVRTGVAPLS